MAKIKVNGVPNSRPGIPEKETETNQREKIRAWKDALNKGVENGRQ